MKLFDSLSGLVNSITGTGTIRDKSMHAKWVFHRMEDAELVAMYRGNWIASKIVNIPVDDMLREGWSWQADDDDTTKLEAEERRLGLKQKLHQVLIRDGLYGGGALIIGDGSSDPSQPLLPERIGLGGIKYLMATGRGELIIEKLSEDLQDNYGQPVMFKLMSGTRGAEVRIHPSRVVAFNGQPIPTPNGLLSPDDWWGDSRLASVIRDIGAASAGISGIGRLMDELAITYHKIKNLPEKLSQKGGEDAVRRMINLINQMKSSVNSAAIDSEDDIEVITAAFTGIPDAMRTLMQNVSGSADIPVTRFLGASPDGMNATGASDIRNYYDRLAGRRAHYVEPGLVYLDQFLIPSALGRNADDIYRIWNPLWQMTDIEQIDYDTKRLTALKTIGDSAMIHDHVIEQVTRNIMIDSPAFIGAETAFDEADKMPEEEEPTPEEVAAANALQAGAAPGPSVAPRVAPPKLRVVGDAGTVEEWDLNDVKSWMSQPRHPVGTRQGGQFSGGASMSNYGPRTPDGWEAPAAGGGGGASTSNFPSERLEKMAKKKLGDNSTVEEQDIQYEISKRGVAWLDEPSDSNPEMTNAEQFATGFYTGDGYKRLSDHLRKGKKDDFAEYFAEKLDGIMSRQKPIESEQLVYRVIDNKTAKAISTSVGATFTDKGFVSTTASEAGLRYQQINNDRAKSGWTMIMRIPKGNKMLDMRRHSWAREEDERMLPRGMKFKIVGVDANRKEMEVDVAG